MIDKKCQPIAIFDSGIGGLSVLNEATKTLPNEDFIYFSDLANFPYGDKKTSELKKIILKNIKTLIEKDCKAVVIACNTATSVAINDLRKEFSIPIIGMEPAIKPALEKRHKKILVLATPITLKLDKFNELRTKLDKGHDLIILPAKGLASLIENYVIKKSDKKEITKYLKKLFSNIDIDKDEISTIVLGCTHYVFIKELIRKIFTNIKIIDGNIGTINRLQSILKDKNLLNNKNEKGNICQINTK